MESTSAPQAESKQSPDHGGRRSGKGVPEGEVGGADGDPAPPATGPHEKTPRNHTSA